MFGKNMGTYLVSHPPLHHLNGGEISFHHHDLLSGSSNNFYLAPQVLESTALFTNHQAGGGGGIILSGEYSSSATAPAAASAKKDRHSKIQTSQGPRDRRVRLSIGIARKFFDLQELLGFDKPSKTLDWLLTKSKAAIKDLVQSKKTAGSGSEPDVGSQENSSKRKSASPAFNLAKESRARARARARERTREKMCMKKMTEAANSTGFGPGQNPANNGPIQYVNNNFFEANYSAADAGTHDHHHQDLIQESNILIKRRIKNPSIVGFQQNYSTPLPYSAMENWDISSFSSYSNISAIFDQHKFMNSNSGDN